MFRKTLTYMLNLMCVTECESQSDLLTAVVDVLVKSWNLDL